MSQDARGRSGDFDPRDLLKSADFLKWEDADVSADLRALEGQILAHVTAGESFRAAIPPLLLAEVGAEIFDTLLSDYLKWYKCSVIAVRMPAKDDRLAFAGYVHIEKPLHLGLGVAYEMANAVGEGGWPANGLSRLVLARDSVKVVVHAGLSIRAVVGAMKIESSVHQMLEDPAAIIRKTLECRLRAAYGSHQPLGAIGLSIENGIVNVAIYPAETG